MIEVNRRVIRRQFVLMRLRQRYCQFVKRLSHEGEGFQTACLGQFESE